MLERGDGQGKEGGGFAQAAKSNREGLLIPWILFVKFFSNSTHRRLPRRREPLRLLLTLRGSLLRHSRHRHGRRRLVVRIRRGVRCHAHLGRGGEPSIGESVGVVFTGLLDAAAGDSGAGGGELFDAGGGRGGVVRGGDGGRGGRAEAEAGEAVIVVVGKKMRSFFEGLMQQVKERQEAMQQRFLEAQPQARPLYAGAGQDRLP